MDFLDPRKKRNRNIRLIVGYFLMAVVIGLSTIILVYGANGYGINTKTGKIIENGLLFVDSQPGGAQIILNGQVKGATATRLILPAAPYNLALRRDGYREWKRSFSLDEHNISRFTYPQQLPLKPQVSSLKTYSGVPPLITQSPDRHWLLIQNPDVASGITFDEYDTGALTKAPLGLGLPTNLLSDGGQSAKLVLVDWSSDNTHLLLRHDFSGGFEFIVFNRAKPEDSFNVNKLFNTNPSQVFLHNQKIDQLYIFDQTTQTVRLGDVGKKSMAAPLLNQVLAFKPYTSDLASYVTDKGMAKNQVEARIWSSGRTYSLYKLKAATTYLLDAGSFQSHWYYAVGTSSESRQEIFKDPLDSLKDPSKRKAVPLLALSLDNVSRLSFSPTNQYIEADNGAALAIYDVQTQQSYKYNLPANASAPLVWLDGSHFIGDVNGQLYIMDYDSQNAQALTDSSEPDGGFISRDFNHLLTVLQN